MEIGQHLQTPALGSLSRLEMGGQDLRNPHSLRVQRARQWAGRGWGLCSCIRGCSWDAGAKFRQHWGQD